MRIRIMGNSASGKTTIARSISNYFNIGCLHMDGINFVPNSDFKERDRSDVKQDVNSFLSTNESFVIDGNYDSILNESMIIPDLIIFIDLPIEVSLENFANRYLLYKGKSRPELTGQVETNPEEMIEWISNWENRKSKHYRTIMNYQLTNPLCHVISLETMEEVCALADNPNLLSELY